MFDALTANGCESNVFTYNILINGFCKKKMINEAL